MEPTVRQVADVYAALKSIKFNCRLKYKDARKFSDLKKVFEERISVIVQLERDLLSKYHAEKNDDTSFHFDSAETANQYLEEFNSMMNEKDDVPFVPVDLSDYIDNIEIAVESVDALDGIILFNMEG